MIEKLFDHLPYKLKIKFIAFSQKNEGNGLFTGLREILEKAAKDANSFLEQHLFENLNQKKMNRGANPAKATAFGSNTKRYNVCATKDQVEERRTAKPCLVCGAKHPLWVCEVFKNQSVQERSKLVHERRLCNNCLRGGHFTNESKFRKCCSICERKHNTLLHRESQPLSEDESKINDKESQAKDEEKAFVTEDDRDALRFLRFRGGDLTEVGKAQLEAQSATSATSAIA